MEREEISERAKRARHLQWMSIEIRDILLYNSTCVIYVLWPLAWASSQSSGTVIFVCMFSISFA